MIVRGAAIWRGCATAVLVAALVLGAPRVPGDGLHALGLRLAAADAAALASLRLTRTLTAPRVRQEIDAALAENDADLARSFVALADEQGLELPDEARARVQAAQEDEPLHAAQDLARGFAVGDAQSVPGLIGAVAGDLVGYGDLRDLAREGAKAFRGEDADELLLGLSVVGLALTGATFASAGGALPARGGVTAIKSARAAGHLSAPLAAYATRAVRGAVDQKALKATFAAAKRLDAAGVRMAAAGAVRPAGLKSLARLTDDAAAIYSRTGARGLRQSLRIAENGDEVRRIARLAEARGPSTRAVLKVLGRGAIVLGSVSGMIVSWTLALLAYAFGTALLARRIGLWLGRAVWRRPALRRRDSPAPASS